MAFKWWKVRRELKRLTFQLRDLPKSIASIPGRIMHDKHLKEYDRDFEKMIKLTSGRVNPAGKYAIFLIYQPKGIPASLWYTLGYLRQSGYAVLAVINSKISAEDRLKLAENTWKILDRPNFGYDFGGYRDGLHILQREVDAPEALIIMNDSVWFPMQGDPLKRMEATLNEGGYDAVGLNQDQKVRYHDDGSQTYELRNVESYFYLFSKSFVQNPDFKAFWKNYRMSSDKSYTIKHGEIGFSRYVMERGAKFHGLLQRQGFIMGMEQATASEMLQALEYGVYADDHYARDGAALIADYDGSEVWAAKAYLHIRAVASRRPFNTSFPLAADRLFGTPYIKKNSQLFFHQMRMQILRGIDNGLIDPPPPVLLAEFRKMVEDYERNPPENAERTL